MKPMWARPAITMTTPTMIASMRGQGDGSRRVATRQRQRRDRRGDHRAEGGVRAEHEHARRAEDGVADEAEDRRVEPGHRRQPGQLGVGHPLGHEEGGEHQAGHDVLGQPRPLVRRGDAEAGDEGPDACGRLRRCARDRHARLALVSRQGRAALGDGTDRATADDPGGRQRQPSPERPLTQRRRAATSGASAQPLGEPTILLRRTTGTWVAPDLGWARLLRWRGRGVVHEVLGGECGTRALRDQTDDLDDAFAAGGTSGDGVAGSYRVCRLGVGAVDGDMACLARCRRDRPGREDPDRPGPGVHADAGRGRRRHGGSVGAPLARSFDARPPHAHHRRRAALRGCWTPRH